MKNVCLFCGSRMSRNPQCEADARRLGELVAAHGCTLLYGGSNLGYMGTASAAALRGGARVVGIIPTLFGPEVIESQPGVEIVRVASMGERKERMIAQGDAFVALPGGIGTLDEVSEVMVANQLHICSKPLALLNTNGFFDPFLAQLDRMAADGLLQPECREALLVDDDVEALFSRLLSAMGR